MPQDLGHRYVLKTTVTGVQADDAQVASDSDQAQVDNQRQVTERIVVVAPQAMSSIKLQHDAHGYVQADFDIEAAALQHTAPAKLA